jgi:hypothetical protein
MLFYLNNLLLYFILYIFLCLVFIVVCEEQGKYFLVGGEKRKNILKNVSKFMSLNSAVSRLARKKNEKKGTLKSCEEKI